MKKEQKIFIEEIKIAIKTAIDGYVNDKPIIDAIKNEFKLQCISKSSLLESKIDSITGFIEIIKNEIYILKKDFNDFKDRIVNELNNDIHHVEGEITENIKEINENKLKLSKILFYIISLIAGSGTICGIIWSLYAYFDHL